MKYLILALLLMPGLIYSQSPIIKAENSTSFINDTVAVAITASDISDIGAITLKIQFTSGILAFLDVVNVDSRLNEALSGIDGNVITFAWDGLNSVSYTNGKIADLRFVYKGGLGEIKFNSSLCEIADSNGKKIPCSFIDGKVTQALIPAKPVPVSPADQSRHQPSDIKLSWKPSKGADSYSLNLYEYIPKSSGTVINLRTAAADITAASVDVSGLLEGTKYVWTVKARNAAGVSDSSVSTFSTKLNTPVELKALVYDNIIVKLSWLDKSKNEQGYIIERATDNKPVKIIASVPADQNSFTDSLPLPSIKNTYRIKAFNAVDSSDYSNEATVELITAVNKPAEIPEDFALSQNFPNPFNPSTMIRYSLPAEARIRVSVYNTLGKIVNGPVNKVQPAGNYEYLFNATGMPSGIYYYSINAQSTDGRNNYNAVRKMMLVR